MLLIIDNQGGFAREMAPFAEELKIIFARDAAQVTPNLPILKPEDVIIVPHTNIEATLREQGITNKIVPLQYRNATVQDLYIAAMGHPRYGTYLDNPFELVVDSVPAERPAPAPKTDKRAEAPRSEQREPRQEQREPRPERRDDRQERRDEQRRDNKRDDRRDNKNQRDRKDQRQGDKQRQERRDNKNQRQDKQRQDREPRQEQREPRPERRDDRQERRDEQHRDNKRDEQRRTEQREQVIATPEIKPEPAVVPAEPVFEIPAFEEVPSVEPVKPEPVAETANPKPQVGPQQVREVIEFEVERRTDGRVNEGTVKIDRPGRNGYVDYLVYADGRKEEVGRRNPVSRQERVGTKPVPKDEGSGAPASEPETIVPAFDFGGGQSVTETVAQDIQIDGPVLDMGSEPSFKTEEPSFKTEDAAPNFLAEPKVDAPVFKTAGPEINFVSEDDKPVFKTEPATPRFTDEPSFKTEPAAPNFVTEDEAPNFVTEPVADAPVFKTEEPVFKTEAAPNFVTETPTVRVQPQAAPAQQAPKPVIRQRNAGDFDDDELGLVRDQAPEPADEGGDFTLNFI